MRLRQDFMKVWTCLVLFFVLLLALWFICFWVCFLHEWLDRRWQCVLSWAWACFSLSEVFTCICWCLWDRRTGSSTKSRSFNCFQIVYWISFLTRAVVAFITQLIITRKRNVTAGIFVWPLSLPGKCLWHCFRERLCRTFLSIRLWRDNYKNGKQTIITRSLFNQLFTLYSNNYH